MNTKTNQSFENKRIIIDQLRKDKIIYGVEAVATNIICLFVFLFSNRYLTGFFQDFINTGVLLIAVFYSLYMGVGNFIRLKRIQALEKELGITL